MKVLSPGSVFLNSFYCLIRNKGTKICVARDVQKNRTVLIPVNGGQELNP
jgi:hypothetical protein